VGPDGKQQGPAFEPDSNQTDIRVVKFSAPFKESAQYRIELPNKMIDLDGRPLSNVARFPLTVATAEFPPLAKFAARFGIIEAADPVVPVTVRNLEPELAGARLNVGKSQSGKISSARGLLDRIDATFWRVPIPDARTALTWLNKVADAKRH